MTALALWSLRAAVAILLGLALAGLLRRRSAAVRSMVLRATLVVALSLPLVALVAPRLAVPLPAAAAVPAPSPIAPAFEAPAPLSPAAPSSTEPGPAVGRAVVNETPRPTDRSAPVAVLAGALYMSGVLALVGRWLAGFARLRRIAQKATPFGDESGILRGAVAVPATYGRTILMPLEAVAWPEARVRAAILHERAHVRRRDWIWQTLAALFAAVHWANPAAWILARLLRDTAEAAADDEALAHMTPSDYARELLAVARNVGPTGPALAMARRGGVKDRIAAVLGDRERKGPSGRLAGTLLALLAIVGLAVAGVTTERIRREALDATPDPSGSDQAISDPPAPVSVSGRPLRLLGLWEIGPKSIRSWGADGGPAPKELAARAGRVDDFERKTDADKRNVKLVFHLPSSSRDYPGLVLRATPILRGFGSGVRNDRNGRTGTTYTFLCEVPRDAPARTDVRLGVADGTWRTVPVSKGRYLVHKPPRYDSDRRNGRVEVEVEARIPAAISNGQYRLVAFDAKGRRLEESGYTTTNDDRVAAGFYAPGGIPGGIAGGIARVIFEARPYRDVVFRNVPLRPIEPRPTDPPTAARLLGVVDRAGNRWDAVGNPLPNDAAPAEDMARAGYRTEPGSRQVRLDVALVGARPGASVAFDVPPPVETRTSGIDPRTGRGFIHLAVPPGIATSNLRVGVADGAWRTVPNGDALRRTARPNANFAPAYNLDVFLPVSLRGEELRLRLRNRDGSTPEPLMTGSSPESAMTLVKGRPEDLASVGLEHRPYRWSLLRSVRLAPKGERIAAAPWGPYRIGERSVRLVAVTEEGFAPRRIWRPDGRITNDETLTPSGSVFVGSGSKLYRFALEVRGAPPIDPDVRVGVHPEGLADVWGMPDGRGRTETPNTVGRTYWPAVSANMLGLSSDVQAELRLGPWRTLGEARGGRKGALTVEIGATRRTASGAPWTEMSVRLSGPQPPADQALELAGFDAEGKRLATIDGLRLVDGRWNLGASIARPKRVVRWTLRARRVDRVLFRNVRLVPQG